MSEAHLTMGAHAAPPMEERPFAIPSKKLAMWLFIMSDVMTFAACVVAYAFTRNATPEWPRPFHSVSSVAVMTLIMLTCSLTMLIALNAAKMSDKARAFRWMMITAAGGVLFTLLHIRDWMGMMSQGVGLFQNPWGPAAFGAAFYSVTGFSLLHISGGTIALIVVAIRYQGGRYNADDIEIVNLFWQFVGLVWLFIVPVVYLMNLAR
ncbi:MAG TPA: cytochrome c oxidase subunit 3 [Terriglobales bacterium]